SCCRLIASEAEIVRRRRGRVKEISGRGGTAYLERLSSPAREPTSRRTVQQRGPVRSSPGFFQAAGRPQSAIPDEPRINAGHDGAARQLLSAGGPTRRAEGVSDA